MTFKKRYFLFEFIFENPGLTIGELAEKLNWRRRKVLHYADKVVKDKVVLPPKYFPVPFKDLINWDEMKHIKKPTD